MALDFDGTDDHITFSASVLQKSQGSFSVWSATERADTYGSSFYWLDSSTARIAMLWDGGNSRIWGYLDGYSTFFNSPTWTANEWTHYAMCWETTTPLIRLYKNGVEHTSVTTSDSVLGNSLDTTAYLGSRFNLSSGEFFLGDLAEAAFFPGTFLSQAQVTALSRGVSPIIVDPSCKYVPMFGPEALMWGGEFPPTVVSSPVRSAHPGIIYPSNVPYLDYSGAAPPAGADGEFLGLHNIHRGYQSMMVSSLNGHLQG